MANSAVSICSNALQVLGDKPIDSFDLANDRTRLAANLYASKRDFVLRSHPWNCAIKRVILSPDAVAPVFGWAYQYALPGDWLRTLSVGVDDSTQDDYQLEGRQILMDIDTCRLRYIYRNEDEATWDASLVNAMTQVMTAVFAYAITKSTNKQAGEEDLLKMILKSARAVDAQENPPETMGDFPLLASRYR